MASTGLTREDYIEEIDIWPENVAYVEFFMGLGSGAWCYAANGGGGLQRVGLRDEVLPFHFERCGIKRKKWGEYYEALRHLETGALEAMSSK